MSAMAKMTSIPPPRMTASARRSTSFTRKAAAGVTPKERRRAPVGLLGSGSSLRGPTDMGVPWMRYLQPESARDLAATFADKGK